MGSTPPAKKFRVPHGSLADALISNEWYSAEPEKYNFYLVSPWSHPITSINYVDFWILMPSGINRHEQYSLKIAECGTKLSLDIYWPQEFTDKSILVKIGKLKDPEITDLHPSVSGINFALRQLTEKINEHVVRQYYMDIPIEVEQLIKFVQATKTIAGTSVVMCRLKGITDTYVQNAQETGAIVKADF